jgi:hypothetical protein
MPGPGEVAYALEDQLIALITAATTNGGRLNAPSQYAAVKVVERVAPPEQRIFPNVAAQFRNLTETASGMHTEEVTATFDLAVAVQQPYTAGQTGTIAQARANLRPFVDDGAGNGLLELLRSQPTLGNLCRRSKVISVDEVTLMSGAATAGSIVAALIVFECQYSVKI